MRQQTPTIAGKKGQVTLYFAHYNLMRGPQDFAHFAWKNWWGQGAFLEFDVPGGDGHYVIGHPQSWSTAVEDYLNSLPVAEKK